jgi:CDP-diacylglycerol--glycerol-3-phosphate 3-phosphatidyltransferase
MIEGLKPFYSAVLRPIGRLLIRLHIHPNALTISGLVFFAIAGWQAAVGNWGWSIFWGVFASCYDGLDGLVAREGGRVSPFGAMLDSTTDRVTEILWIGGIIWFYLRSPQPIAVPGVMLGLAMLSGSMMVSYVKAAAERSGYRCNRGIFQRPERIILVSVFLLTPPRIMLWGLGVMTALAWLTVIQRVIVAFKASQQEQHHSSSQLSRPSS